jgi:hypothetical protein
MFQNSRHFLTSPYFGLRLGAAAVEEGQTIRRNPNGPNPLLYGRDRAARYWPMTAECDRARVIALERARGRS